MPEYDSWEQIAGYFDADGTIVIFDLSNIPYKLGLSLSFVDQSIDQIRMVRNFLRKAGIRTSNVLRQNMRSNAWIVAIGSVGQVKECLRLMIPHLSKKAIEARAVLDYYDGKITGNELVAVFRSEVEAGRRERRDRKVPIDVPFTYPVGKKALEQMRTPKLRDAFGRYRTKVSAEDLRQIREAQFNKGKSVIELIKAYPRYGGSTIRRILTRDRD